MADMLYKKAIREDRLQLAGPRVMTRNITIRMSNRLFAEAPRATEIELEN